MPYTTVTAAITVTPSSSPTVVVVTQTLAASDLSRFSITPTASPGADASHSSSLSPSPSSSATSTENGGASNSALVGAVAGGLVGGFAFFTLLVVMACLIRRRSKRKAGGPGRGRFKGQRVNLVGSSLGGAAAAAAAGRFSKEGASFVARPGLYARSGPHSRSDSSALVSLMPAHGAASDHHHGAHTPSSSMGSNGPRYSLLPLQPATAGYQYVDPYAHDIAPASVANRSDPRLPAGVYERSSSHSPQPSGQSRASSAHSMARLGSEGSASMVATSNPASRSSLALSRPLSGATFGLGPRSSEAHRGGGGGGFGSAGSTSDAETRRPGSTQSLSLPTSRWSRPSSAGSSSHTAQPRPPSAILGSPAYSTSAAAYAIPTPTFGTFRDQQKPPINGESEMMQRTPSSQRPPVAGLPLLPSNLSTIQGSISEGTMATTTTTDGSDSLRRDSNVSGATVRQGEGVSSVPRLPSIPASSPLIVQGSASPPRMKEKQDGASGAIASTSANHTAGTYLSTSSGTPSRGTGEGTLESFNTFTGMKKSDLHVVGTLSSQNSTLPPIAAHDEAEESTAVDANTERCLQAPPPRESWSVDSQGLEFWLRSEGDSKPKSASNANSRPMQPSVATGAQPAGRHTRPAHERASSGTQGSRLIEMFERSSAGHGQGATKDPLGAQSKPETFAPIQSQGQNVGSLSSGTAAPSASAAATRSPHGSDHASDMKPKRGSSSPLHALGLRLGKPAKPSDTPSSSAQAGPAMPALSLDDLPPLQAKRPLSSQPSAPLNESEPGASHLGRSKSRESGDLLGSDFFSSATFAQPLTIPALSFDGNSGLDPPASQTGSGQAMQAAVKVTRSPLGALGLNSTATAVAPPAKGDRKGKAKKDVSRSNEIDIDQLF